MKAIAQVEKTQMNKYTQGIQLKLSHFAFIFQQAMLHQQMEYKLSKCKEYKQVHSLFKCLVLSCKHRHR